MVRTKLLYEKAASKMLEKLTPPLLGYAFEKARLSLYLPSKSIYDVDKINISCLSFTVKRILITNNIARHLNLESILPNFFLRKTKIFFCFLLLSLSVCNMRKYCLYFEMAKLKSKNRKNEEIKVW